MMYYDGPSGMLLDLVGPAPDGMDLMWNHPYAYVNNNPVTYSDPSGMNPYVDEGRGYFPPPKFPPPGSDPTTLPLDSDLGWVFNSPFGCWCPNSRAKMLKDYPAPPYSAPPKIFNGVMAGNMKLFSGLPPRGETYGTGGAATCVGVIIKCPSGVAAYHFNTGNVPSFGPYEYEKGCQAIMCGGTNDRTSLCLMTKLLNDMYRANIPLAGILPTSSCYVGSQGEWYGA